MYLYICLLCLPLGAGEPFRKDRRCSGIVRVLHKATSKMDVSLPTTDVTITAASLGIFLLKGIQGNHSLCQIMPQELQSMLHRGSKRSIARKLQRGKATSVEPPKPNQQPWTPQVTLLDIFSLPMVPMPAGGSRAEQLLRQVSNRTRSIDSQPEASAFSIGPGGAAPDTRALQRLADHSPLRPADRTRSSLSQPEAAAFSIEIPTGMPPESRSQADDAIQPQ